MWAKISLSWRSIAFKYKKFKRKRNTSFDLYIFLMSCSSQYLFRSSNLLLFTSDTTNLYPFEINLHQSYYIAAIFIREVFALIFNDSWVSMKIKNTSRDMYIYKIKICKYIFASRCMSDFTHALAYIYTMFQDKFYLLTNFLYIQLRPNFFLNKIAEI